MHSTKSRRKGRREKEESIFEWRQCGKDGRQEVSVRTRSKRRSERKEGVAMWPFMQFLGIGRWRQSIRYSSRPIFAFHQSFRKPRLLSQRDVHKESEILIARLSTDNDDFFVRTTSFFMSRCLAFSNGVFLFSHLPFLCNKVSIFGVTSLS